MFVKTLTASLRDCDGLGHVNHAAYFEFMEEARRDVFELFNPGLRLASWNLIVGSARCDFLAQVTYAEALEVATWIGRVGNSSFVVDHALRNAEGKWVARGQATLIHYDYGQRCAQPLPPAIRRTLLGHGEGPEGAPGLHWT